MLFAVFEGESCSADTSWRVIVRLWLPLKRHLVYTTNGFRIAPLEITEVLVQFVPKIIFSVRVEKVGLAYLPSSAACHNRFPQFETQGSDRIVVPIAGVDKAALELASLLLKTTLRSCRSWSGLPTLRTSTKVTVDRMTPVRTGARGRRSIQSESAP